ncbi:hypothetical protein BTW07_08185 [Salinicola socius]|uniref:Uncharacterized protein n=1 Tax=Salinicola socius TaxID=404433 RepID=A0A1Q8STK2_9GAMM|nr:hypothetical protein BTW07_08185 [Salinicola socius]
MPKTSDSTDLLAAAFSGMPLNKIGNAIKNVHTAQEKFLSSLDPRFSVTSEYYEDATKYRLDAVEKGFGINFKFNFKDRPDLRDDLRGFYRQGRPVSIPSELVEVEGSNLFEHIFSEQGELNIVPQGHSAKLKMWLAGNDVDDFFQIDDLDGHVYIGSEEAMFRGECFGGLLSVEHSNISRQLQGALNYTLSLDITKWDHVELLKLPYFNKLKELVEKIVDGWNVLFSLEIKGDVVYKSNPVVISGDEYWRAALDHFNYISSAKTISSLLGVDIAHDSNYVCAGLSALKVKEVADIISGSKAVKFSDLTDFPELSLTVDSPDEVKKVFGNQQGPQEIVSEIAGKSIEIFGRKISLPKEVCRFKGVGLSFSKPLDLLEIGDRIQIVLKPMLPDQEFERYFLGYE